MSMSELASRMSTIGISHHRRTAQKKLTSSVAMSSRARTLAIIGSRSASGQDEESPGPAPTRAAADPGVACRRRARSSRPGEWRLDLLVTRERTRFVKLTDSVGYLVDTQRAHGLPPQFTILTSCRLLPNSPLAPGGLDRATSTRFYPGLSPAGPTG